MNKLVFILLAWSLLSCNRPNYPDYSIEVNGSEIASIKRDGRIFQSAVYESNLENPVITGKFKSNALNLSLNQQSGTTACNFTERVMITASTDNPNDRTGYFLDGFGNYTIGSSIGVVQNSTYSRYPNWIYNYVTHGLYLPENRQVLNINLSVSQNIVLTGMIKLVDSIIVIPVHVHVFVFPNRPPPNRFDDISVLSWFDMPVTNTQLLLTDNTSCLETTNYSLDKIYFPVDTIWSQAGIQFSLKSYDIIENADLARNIFGNNRNDTRPSDIHASTYMNIPGIHIYIGGNTSNNNLFGETQGPSLCEEEGRTEVNRGNLIVLGYNSTLRNALAHEIGHYLGLKHVDEPYFPNCGSNLVENSEELSQNLMGNFGGAGIRTKISKKQSRRSRYIACQYLQLWNMANNICVDL